MARSKVLPKLDKGCKAKIAAHVDEPVECPLCIETLDDTDRDFFPCPCGYQVCLFCYQRLQSEYNNTCPGCRQQYSDDLDAVRQHIERKQLQQQAEVVSRPAASSSSHHAGHGGHGHGHAAHGHGHMQHHNSHAAHTHSHAAGHRAKPGAPSTAKQRHHHEVAPGSHGRASHEAAGSGLPASANWVTAGPSSLHNLSSMDSSPDVPPPPAAVDESAWPTLGVATSNSQQQQQKHEGPVRRQSSSSSLSSMHSQQQQQQQQQQVISRRQDPSRSSCDSTASTLTGLMEQQQQPEQQQQELERKGSGFTSVEVTTVVAGARHSVCVPVSNHSEVPAFPEAATLLEMLQAAVNGSKLSSTEAAVQLVQLLRKLEADSQAKQQNLWLQQALANGRNGSGGGRNGTVNGAVKHAVANGTAGRPPAAPTAGAAARAPPPGFGHSKSAVYAPHLQQQDLVSARGMPYRPVSAGQQQTQQLASQSDAYASQSSMHSVDSNSSLFSQGSSLSQSAVMWTDSGLPGVDFGAGVGGLGSGLGSGIPAAVPARLQMLWAGSNGQTQQGSAAAGSAGVGSGAGSGYATANPPPGFGTSLGLGAGLNGSRLGGGYNPLSYAAANNVAQPTSTPPGFGIADMAALKQQHQQQSIYRPWA